MEKIIRDFKAACNGVEHDEQGRERVVIMPISHAKQILTALEGPSEEEIRLACIDFVDNVDMNSATNYEPEDYEYAIWKAAINWVKNWKGGKG